MFTEPPRTAYDVNLIIGGFPVRIHPMFWFVTLILGSQGGFELGSALTWLAVVFVSILVHEFGHALAFMWYGLRSHIVLHGFGGLAIADTAYRSAIYRGRRYGTPLSEIFVAFAGPLAGFILAGVLFTGIALAGHELAFEWGGRLGFRFRFEPFDSNWVQRTLEDALYVNIFWGLINLFPVFPLDGGRIARGFLTLFNPADGVRQSMILSIMTAAGLALFAFVRLGSPLMALFFGYLAYMSYVTLQQSGYYGGRGW